MWVGLISFALQYLADEASLALALALSPLHTVLSIPLHNTLYLALPCLACRSRKEILSPLRV